MVLIMSGAGALDHCGADRSNDRKRVVEESVVGHDLDEGWCLQREPLQPLGPKAEELVACF
jgi:hypothetical protein